MKSKNIPADINKKTIKEAQDEIKEIIERLESNETNLEDSTEHYNRMIQLNKHIQVKYRHKSNEIRQSSLNKNRKKITKK